MRILQISSAKSFGGGERHFVDLTNELAQRGHEMHIGVIPNSPLIPHLTKIDAGNILTLRLRNALDVDSAFKLRKFSRERQIDIIHAHVARDYSLAALAAGRSRQTKLVLTRHVLFPLSSVHRLTRRRVSRVIAVSQAVADNLRNQNLFQADQISVIRHGIDLERFQTRRSSARAGGTMRVGTLGELSQVRGQEDFVRAAALVAAERDDVNFVIAGNDNSAAGRNRKGIEALINELDLSSRVNLAESAEDVGEFFSELDVYVSTARSEAFGLAMVEAMASGVPVVATATPGAQEIIQDNQTGRLVPIRDVSELAHVIGELLSDQSRRELLSESACASVAECFSLKRMADETEEVYRQVISER